MPGSLASKRVVVLGGTSGIGFGVARAAREAGAGVVIASSSAAKVDAAVARFGDGVEGVVADVTSEADLARLFGGLGTVDHVVFTAGDWGPRLPGPPAEWDIATAEGVFAVRFWGAVKAIKHAQRSIPAGGSITLTDGLLAHRPRRGAALSTAMLGAIEHLARGLAVELAPVRINVVCPGLVRTERHAGAPDEQMREMTRHQPIPRAADPAEIAEAYLYLMRGTFTTGQVLIVDGGRGLV